jgi:hypothetical protein
MAGLNQLAQLFSSPAQAAGIEGDRGKDRATVRTDEGKSNFKLNSKDYLNTKIRSPEEREGLDATQEMLNYEKTGDLEHNPPLTTPELQRYNNWSRKPRSLDNTD